MRLNTPDVSGKAVRMIVRPTIGGSSVRVKIENTLGEAPVVFSAAYFGQVMSGADLIPDSNQQLTFAGAKRLNLAPGQSAWSDPIDYSVAASTRYAVSLDVDSASDISAHVLGLVTNFMADGMRAAQGSGDGFAPVPDLAAGTPVGATFPVYWVAVMDVHAPNQSGAIVAFGDSITDGRCSTKEQHGSTSGAVVPDVYQRWTDVLAERLAAADQRMAVANEGIAGNRVASDTTISGVSALSRMDRDVLERAGTTHVIFFEGTNDVAVGTDAPTIIAGTQLVIERAHAAGLKIIGVTMIPRGSATGWTGEMEQERLAVNAWMRSGANFDGIVDFAELFQGPTVPSKGAQEILPAYSCYDGIHPNDLGYAAMSGAIDLTLFGGQH
jgi:lysophospholipase L1-like esterase